MFVFRIKKEKVTLEGYIYYAGSYIISSDKMTYDIYLKHDPNVRLSQDDFKSYSDIELKFRLCLLDAFIYDKLLTRKLKINNYDYGVALGKGLAMAFGSNGYDVNRISKMMNDLKQDFEGYKAYAIKNEYTFPKVMPILNYVFYYFSMKYFKNYSYDIDKNYTFGVLLKANELTIVEYLESTYKSVKIIN
ncbi:MAG: hypothetical protein H5T96_06950 [Tissierellales bacterium]|nr:hypothetical protein [Tissierellales bacterium]